MTWKPVTGQTVVARLDGRVREVLVTDWESYSGAVKVAWPPPQPLSAVLRSFPDAQRTQRTKIDEAQYEPIDPESFRMATRG